MKYSGANRCEEAGKMGKKESGAIQNWIMNTESDAWKTGRSPNLLKWDGWEHPEHMEFFRKRCQELKNGYDKGCLNFVEHWVPGWNEGNVKARMALIKCPEGIAQKTTCPAGKGGEMPGDRDIF